MGEKEDGRAAALRFCKSVHNRSMGQVNHHAPLSHGARWRGRYTPTAPQNPSCFHVDALHDHAGRRRSFIDVDKHHYFGARSRAAWYHVGLGHEWIIEVPILFVKDRLKPIALYEGKPRRTDLHLPVRRQPDVGRRPSRADPPPQGKAGPVAESRTPRGAAMEQCRPQEQKPKSPSPLFWRLIDVV